MTPGTKDKGKGRAMTVDISPSQPSSLSPPWTSRSLAHVPSASTLSPPAKGLVPCADSQVFSLSPDPQINAGTHELPVSDVLDRGIAKLGAAR